ncbi:sensor histidine kinase [Flavobacterium sp. RNTU_13]|uniref:sensor histidine kinase n=1 Tax=Flavobacterium sp. RNTU_13 TaxID=3375145 RepID=UPI0039860CA8
MQDNVAFGIIVSILLVSLIILFCALIIKLYIRKVKNYTKLIYEKDLDYERTLKQTILETQEQLLLNVSRELHDDAGQQLTYLNFMVEHLKYDAPEITPGLDNLSNALANLSNSVRRMSHSLNGQMLVQQNIVRAIQAETQRLTQLNAFKVNFVTDADETKSLAPNAQIVIFRIFQEITNNILKYANATEVTISIKTEPRFKFTVSDNGCGFDYQAIKASGSKGMGLANIENRAALVGMDVRITSSPAGTTVCVSEK